MEISLNVSAVADPADQIGELVIAKHGSTSVLVLVVEDPDGPFGVVIRAYGETELPIPFWMGLEGLTGPFLVLTGAFEINLIGDGAALKLGELESRPSGQLLIDQAGEPFIYVSGGKSPSLCASLRTGSVPARQGTYAFPKDAVSARNWKIEQVRGERSVAIAAFGDAS